MWLDLIGAWLDFYALRPINNLSIVLHTHFILPNFKCNAFHGLSLGILNYHLNYYKWNNKF
jgi:hypothetical protein